MTDTHTHLYLSEYEDGGKEAVNRGLEAGVKRFLFPNVDFSTVHPLLSLHNQFPDCTYIAAGLHPTEVDENWREMSERIFREFEGYELNGIGEIGIDLYWDKRYVKEQQECLTFQLRKAKVMNLPAILHCRDGLDELLEVVQQLGDAMPESVMHSFTGDSNDVKKIRRYFDPMFGINGVVTFKNAQSLRDALPEIGINRIVTETDAPYLTPVPYRGKRNESAYLPFILQKIAEVFHIPVEFIETETDKNASELMFGSDLQ